MTTLKRAKEAIAVINSLFKPDTLLKKSESDFVNKRASGKQRIPPIFLAATRVKPAAHPVIPPRSTRTIEITSKRPTVMVPMVNVQSIVLSYFYFPPLAIEFL